MSKKKPKTKLTEEDIRKLEAIARRIEDLKKGLQNPKNHIHTSKKSYSRKNNPNKPKNNEE